MHSATNVDRGRSEASSLLLPMWATADVQVVNTFITVIEGSSTLPVQRSSSAPPGFSRECTLGLQQNETRKLQQKETHDAGHCKPCAYLEKAKTCRWGDSCDFCHFCPPGEIVRQKKAKRNRIRKENKLAWQAWNNMQSPAADERGAESGTIAGCTASCEEVFFARKAWQGEV